MSENDVPAVRKTLEGALKELHSETMTSRDLLGLSSEVIIQLQVSYFGGHRARGLKNHVLETRSLWNYLSRRRHQ